MYADSLRFDLRSSVCISVICVAFSSDPASAQLTRDWQLHGIATVLADRFVGGGLGFGVRPPGRLRFAGTASAGDLKGTLAGRAEAFLAFHLNPGREKGFTPYTAAGVAASITRAATRGYVEVLIGLEQRPGRRSGLFVEAGVGGGLRLSAGFRMRSGSGIKR
jgi:hypothetical protein